MKIGIIGAGQLGRMLALAGYPLAQQFRFLDTSADSPGGQVAPIITGAFDDPRSLERLAADVDLVTYEFENVPVAALQKVAADASRAGRRSRHCAFRRTACSRSSCSRR